MIHEIFNLIIKQNSMAPNSWNKALITVIYKKGDVTNPENSRPICGLPQSLQTLLHDAVQLALRRALIGTGVPTRQDSEKHSEQLTTV